MNTAIAEHWCHVAPILARPANDADLDRKIAHLDSLLDVGAEQEGHPLSGLVDILSDQIERYESERFAGCGKATGLDAIKFMMAEHGLTQAAWRASAGSIFGKPRRWQSGSMSDWRHLSIEGGPIRQSASAATIMSRWRQPANATTTASKPTNAHTRTLPVGAGLGAGSSSLVSSSRRACCSLSNIAKSRASRSQPFDVRLRPVQTVHRRLSQLTV